MSRKAYLKHKTPDTNNLLMRHWHFCVTFDVTTMMAGKYQAALAVCAQTKVLFPFKQYCIFGATLNELIDPKEAENITCTLKNTWNFGPKEISTTDGNALLQNYICTIVWLLQYICRNQVTSLAHLSVKTIRWDYKQLDHWKHGSGILTGSSRDVDIKYKAKATWSTYCNNLSRNTTKPTKWSMRPAEPQISLGIRPVWSESSLCAQWVGKGCPCWLESSLGAHAALLVLSWGGSHQKVSYYVIILYDWREYSWISQASRSLLQIVSSRFCCPKIIFLCMSVPNLDVSGVCGLNYYCGK